MKIVDQKLFHLQGKTRTSEGAVLTGHFKQFLHLPILNKVEK